MIDKFFYWLFDIVDSYGQWIEKQFNKPKKKKKLKKVITEEQWIKKMLGKKNGK